MDISFSDNSHITGEPLKVQEETHIFVEIDNRKDVKQTIEKFGHLGNLHIAYKNKKSNQY